MRYESTALSLPIERGTVRKQTWVGSGFTWFKKVTKDKHSGLFVYTVSDDWQFASKLFNFIDALKN